MLYISCPQPQQRSLNQNGGKLKAKAARYFTHVECMVCWYLRLPFFLAFKPRNSLLILNHYHHLNEYMKCIIEV
jgi:hypothetical protein